MANSNSKRTNSLWGLSSSLIHQKKEKEKEAEEMEEEDFILSTIGTVSFFLGIHTQSNSFSELGSQLLHTAVFLRWYCIFYFYLTLI
jgi:hypothetical protein